MKQNMSIRKCREHLTWCIFGATLLFVTVGLGIEMASKYKTTNTMDVVLEDATQANVLVTLSEAYSEKKWFKVRRIIEKEVSLSHDTEYLNTHIMKTLQELGHPVIVFSINRRKNVVYKRKGLKSP